jgi:hypothetical protein
MDALSELEGEKIRSGEDDSGAFFLMSDLVQIDDSELPQSMKSPFITYEQCETT